MAPFFMLMYAPLGMSGVVVTVTSGAGFDALDFAVAGAVGQDYAVAGFVAADFAVAGSVAQEAVKCQI